jgi:1-acyl-sn-glycerol-3-phosphate acyltransferase
VRFVYSLVYLSIHGVVSILYGYIIRGAHNVPRRGGVIVAANHVSGFDPPLVGVAPLREAAYFAKIELFRFPLGPIIRHLGAFPVRRGEADKGAFKHAVRLLSGGACLVWFPEGTRSRTGDFRDPFPGVGALARLARVPIVPAYIRGSKLGNPFNSRPVTVVFGEPLGVDWIVSQGKGGNAAMTVAQEVMRRIRALSETVQ